MAIRPAAGHGFIALSVRHFLFSRKHTEIDIFTESGKSSDHLKCSTKGTVGHHTVAYYQ